MRVAAVSFLLGMLLLSTVAQAEIPSQWSVCKTSADCDVVSSSCGPSLGINVHHKGEAQTEICKTENCSGNCDGSAAQAFAAICKNGQCAPDYTAEPPPAPDAHYELKNLEFRCPNDTPNCGIDHR